MAGIYFLLLVILLPPVVWLAILFPEPLESNDLMGFYRDAYLWVFMVVMVIAQYSLTRIPLMEAGRRPQQRRSIWWPTIAAGFLFGLLVICAIWALVEFTFSDEYDPFNWMALVFFLLCWLGWALYFGRSDGDVFALVEKQRGLLLKGSILELLIAVPTHVAVRQRGYCCAGYLTFTALVAGISVMLICLGPSVYYLYRARWRKLKQDD